jgi:hypothetical protein
MGVVLSILAMAMAAVVEVKRKNVAVDAGMVDSVNKQLFLESAADLFTLAGLLKFFSEAPSRMWSLARHVAVVGVARAGALPQLGARVHREQRHGTRRTLAVAARGQRPEPLPPREVLLIANKGLQISLIDGQIRNYIISNLITLQLWRYNPKFPYLSLNHPSCNYGENFDQSLLAII